MLGCRSQLFLELLPITGAHLFDWLTAAPRTLSFGFAVPRNSPASHPTTAQAARDKRSPGIRSNLARRSDATSLRTTAACSLRGGALADSRCGAKNAAFAAACVG